MRGGGALRESRSRREARVVDVDEGRSATDDGVSVDHGASPVVVLSLSGRDGAQERCCTRDASGCRISSQDVLYGVNAGENAQMLLGERYSVRSVLLGVLVLWRGWRVR